MSCRKLWQGPLEKVHRQEEMLPAPGELSASLASTSQQQLQSPFNFHSLCPQPCAAEISALVQGQPEQEASRLHS